MGHAKYGNQVISFLMSQFSHIRICLFRQKLFPELSEDTFLLLAEGKGSTCHWLSVCAFESIEEALSGDKEGLPVDLDAIRSGRARLFHYLLSPRVRGLYRYLAEQRSIIRLGDAADVGIGYVTGANDFFHLSEHEARSLKIPGKYLLKSIGSLRDHRGLTFRMSDWNSVRGRGIKSFLLTLPVSSERNLPGTVRRYLEQGRTAQIHLRFKCRVRDPWFSVPHIRKADAFLSYMFGSRPRLVLNPAGFVAPNTLHLVRFTERKDAGSIVAAWNSSLTNLSCELEGHALGGDYSNLSRQKPKGFLLDCPGMGMSLILRRKSIGVCGKGHMTKPANLWIGLSFGGALV